MKFCFSDVILPSALYFIVSIFSSLKPRLSISCVPVPSLMSISSAEVTSASILYAEVAPRFFSRILNSPSSPALMGLSGSTAVILIIGSGLDTSGVGVVSGTVHSSTFTEPST